MQHKAKILHHRLRMLHKKITGKIYLIIETLFSKKSTKNAEPQQQNRALPCTTRVAGRRNASMDCVAAGRCENAALRWNPEESEWGGVGDRVRGVCSETRLRLRSRSGSTGCHALSRAALTRVPLKPRNI